MLAPDATKKVPVTSYGPSPVPTGPPPRKELQGLTIDQVNKTVGQVDAHHMGLFGTKAHPGLVFDIARGIGQKVITDVDHLFDIPRSKREALVRGSQPTAEDLAKKDAALTIAPVGYGTPNKQLAKKGIDPFSPSAGAQLAGIVPVTGNFGLLGKGIGDIFASLVNTIPGAYHLGKAATLDARDYAYKFEHDTLHIPIAAPAPKKDMKGGRVADIGAQMGRQVVQDFTHKENWGLALMDFWAVASLGAGTISRTASAAGRAADFERASVAAQRIKIATESDDAGAFIGSVPKRLPPKDNGDLGQPTRFPSLSDFAAPRVGAPRGEKTLQAIEGFRKPDIHLGFELGWGSYTEHIPAFQNAALRAVQGWYLKGAQSRLLERQLVKDADGEFSFDVRNSRISDALFSTENLLHRARINRSNIEYAIATAPILEMDRLTNWQARTRSAIEQDPTLRSLVDEVMGRPTQEYGVNSRAEQRFGVEKALQLIFTDSPDPLSAWRSFHARMIDDLTNQKTEFESFDKDRLVSLQSQTALHNEAASDLEAQAKDLEAGQLHTMPRSDLEPLMRYQPPETATVRNLARKLLSDGFMKEMVQVRKRGDVLRLDGERAHDLVAAAKLAGIEDIPTRVREVGDIEVSNLRKLAQEQTRLAKKMKPELAKAKAIMGLSKKARERQLQEMDYRVASHEGQLQAIDVAERLLANPPKRFKEIVDRAYQISAMQEMLKEVVYGFDPEIGNQHLAEISAILDGERVVPILDSEGNKTNRLGRIVEGPVPDDELRKNVRAATSELRAARRKLETLQLRAARPTKSGKTRPRPKLDADLQATKDRILVAEDGLRKAQEAHDTQGSTIQPLTKAVEGQGETPTTTPSLTTIAEMREGRGSAYFGRLEREVKRVDQPRSILPSRDRKYGFGPPKDQTTAMSRMDGTVLEIGDYRWDTSQLLSSELKQMWKGAFAMVHYHDLWDIGVNEQISQYHMPIRDIQHVPEALRKVIAAMEKHVVEPDAAKMLDEESLSKLRAYLYPDPNNLPTDMSHVRWVDERLVMSRFAGEKLDFWRSVDDVMTKGTGWLNEPWRLLVIFGSPAYILNAGGAAVTLAVEHGFASPALWGKSLASDRIWSPEVTRLLDQLAGSTHAAAITTEKLGKFTAGSQAFYKAWQKITDKSFRRAAVIGELEKRGLIHDGMSPDEVLRVLQAGIEPMLAKLRKGVGEGAMPDASIGRQVIEAAQVGRKQMLDFDKMSWPERALLRHLIFVYAFLRAGSVWSLRFMGEHPVQWAVSAQAGQDRIDQIKQLIGETPEWFRKGAYMAVDNNTVFNPVQFNMPSVLSQVAYSAQSMFNDAPYSSVDDLFGPVATLGTDVARGTTSAGQPLPKIGLPLGSGRLAGSFLDLIENTPPGYAYQRQQKLAKQEKRTVPPPPVSVSETQPLEGSSRRERAFLNLNSFELDGFWNNYGRLIGRTAVPQDVNNMALQARHWRDVRKTDPEAYINHQLDLAHEVAQRQAGVLGLSSVPADVMNALNLVAEREKFIELWRVKEGVPNPGDRQLAVLTIAFLKKEGIINNAKANEYKGTLAKAHGKSAARGVWLKALHENGGQAWADWVQKVNLVNSFNTDSFTSIVSNLRDQTLGDFTEATKVPNETKWAYGRQYADYIEQRNALKDQARAATDSNQRRVLQEQIRALDDKASDDVVVNGTTFPPMRAVQYGKLNQDQRQSYLRGKSIAPWWTLDAYARELLTGKKPDPVIAEGYATLASWMEQASANLKPGEHLPANTRSYYAQTLADRASKNGNTAFRDDLIFAGILPKKDGTKTLEAERLQQTTPIQGSLYRSQWEYLLGYASFAFQRYVKAGWVTSSDKPNYGGIADAWRSYDVPKMQTWLKAQPAGFQQEVDAYEAEHAHFLQRLIKHG